MPVGYVPSAAVVISAEGTVWPVGCLPRGVSDPVDKMTDACENITFPQLLLQKVKLTESWSRKSMGLSLDIYGSATIVRKDYFFGKSRNVCSGRSSIFQRGGGTSSKGGCEKLFFSHYFPKNCVKMKEIGLRGVPGTTWIRQW